MQKSFFHIPSDYAKACILFSIILLGGIGISILLSSFPEKEKRTTQADLKLIDKFLSSIYRDDSIRKKEYIRAFKNKNERFTKLEPFDPNTIDSSTLINMGFKPYIVKNILKYRSKGGKFRTPESFSKIYGISPKQFQNLLPYIYIGERFQPPKYDTLRFEKIKNNSIKPFKYIEGIVIELNSADTTELKKIPQIGIGLAKMIVNYRDKLGGFYSTKQLSEIEYMPLNIEKWFTIKSPIYRHIHINKSSLVQLRNHPYLNFYQAKVIIEHRRRFGKIKSLSDISLYTEFTRKDFERISSYVDFD